MLPLNSENNGAVAPSDISVVIATYCRPEVLRRCLEHIVHQTVAPHEVLVVDASPDDVTKAVVDNFPAIRFERNEEGLGTLPRSRHIGVSRTSGKVIAFLDDDAMAEPSWLFEVATTYGPGVGGVGGRARNGRPGEELEGVDQIGRFYADGTITGFFAANPGCVIEVDHLIGCNMSFRRSALETAGGIPVWPAGVSAVREDLLLSLRIVRAGWTLRFNPRADVFHIGAPQARGRRFDFRYEFTASRNHFFVLVYHYGLYSPIVRRCAARTLRNYLSSIARATAGSIIRFTMAAAGAGFGAIRGVRFHDEGWHDADE